VNERARDFYLRLGFTPDGGTKLEAHAVEPYTASRYRISLHAAAASLTTLVFRARSKSSAAGNSKPSRPAGPGG
jgi:hypothetical protein